MTTHYRFPCGCTWPVVGPPPQEGALPLLDIDDENLPFCRATWEMLGRGDTKGVFQLESPLGRQWTKKLKPTSGEHMGALGALLRPGCIGGDTKVAVAFRPRTRRALNCKKITIREIHEQFVRGHYRYQSGVVSMDEQALTFFNNRLTGATYSGDKPVYRVNLKTGLRPDRVGVRFFDLECTSDHRLLTPAGWTMLCDLRPGVRVAVLNNRCVLCDWADGSLDVNHLSGNRKVDNGPDNLSFLCPHHHRVYTEGGISEQELRERRRQFRLKVTPHVAWLEFTGATYVGVKDTYDLSAAGPHHNFLAGNVVVHNCLRAVDEDGVSMTQRYCRVKSGQEETKTYHPALDWILAPTYGCLVFQEQAMEVAKSVAGFSLMDADALRKAIGKKLPEEMAKVKKMFIEGSAKAGLLTAEQTEEVFGWIEASQRYSFNKCIADTEYIRRPNGGPYGKGQPFTVGEMYRIRNDLAYAKATGHTVLRRKWKLLGNYGKGLSLCADGRVRPNTIVDIRPAGRHPVYRLTLENGSSVRVTGNHKCPTDRGEMTVDDMLAASGPIDLFVCGEYEPSDFRRLNRFSDVTAEQRRARAGRKSVAGQEGEYNYAYTNGSYSEFKKNDKVIPRRCDTCGRRSVRLELHHKDGDRSDSSLTNLVRLCSSCHKKAEYAAGRTKRGEKGYPSLRVRLSGIEHDGEEETYDVEMAAPSHNFVTGQGIVTCNSHAVSYGLTGYDSAYCKAHGPVAFYGNWLRLADEKPDPTQEVAELVNDARLHDVPVLPPDLRNMSPHFYTDGLSVTFGLADVKGVGDKQLEKALPVLEGVEETVGRPLADWSWNDFLFFASHRLPAAFVERLILVGGLRWLGRGRGLMLAEFRLWKELTEAELRWVLDRELLARGRLPVETLLPDLPPLPEGRKGRAAWNRKADAREALAAVLAALKPFSGVADAVRAVARTRPEGGGASSARRVSALRSLLTIHEQEGSRPAASDRPGEVAYWEEMYLGIPLTCSKVDEFDQSDVNTSCKDFAAGKSGYMVFGVTVEGAREVRTKKGKSPGKRMAFLTVADSSCSLLDVVVFPDEWKKYGHLLKEGECVLLQGERDRKQGGLVVKKVCEMTDGGRP